MRHIGWIFGILVCGLVIDVDEVSAELRWNPFAVGEPATALPPPLVAGTSPSSTTRVKSIPRLPVPPLHLPELAAPNIRIPKVSMPHMRLPQVRIPQLSMPEMSMPALRLPEVPRLQPTGVQGVTDRLQSNHQRFMQTARAPFQRTKTPSKFLSQVRQVTHLEPASDLARTTTPDDGPRRATEQPQTVTGWLSQPRPE